VHHRRQTNTHNPNTSLETITASRPIIERTLLDDCNVLMRGRLARHCRPAWDAVTLHCIASRAVPWCSACVNRLRAAQHVQFTFIRNQFTTTTTTTSYYRLVHQSTPPHSLTHSPSLQSHCHIQPASSGRSQLSVLTACSKQNSIKDTTSSTWTDRLMDHTDHY